MKRIFVPFVLAAFFSLGLISASAQTVTQSNGAVGHKPPASAAKTLRVNALSSSSLDGPPTKDDDGGLHFSFTGGVIDRGNPLFDGTISISETVNLAPSPTANAVSAGKVSGVITVGSGKGDRQATIVLEFKGVIKGGQISAEWKVSGATGLAEGMKGIGKLTARRVREGLFMNLIGAIGKPQ